MKTNINRRDFSKLSLLMSGGLLLTPFDVLSIAIMLQNDEEETPYSIKNSSYTVGRMIQKQKLYAPIEYKIDLSGATSSSDLNNIFNEKVNELALKSLNQSSKYSLINLTGIIPSPVKRGVDIAILTGALTRFVKPFAKEILPGIISNAIYDIAKNYLRTGKPFGGNEKPINQEQFKSGINGLLDAISKTHTDLVFESKINREKIEETIENNFRKQDNNIIYLDYVIEDEFIEQEFYISEKLAPIYKSIASLEELRKSESVKNQKDFSKVKDSIKQLNTPLREIKEELSSNSEKIDILNQDIWKASNKVINTLDKEIQTSTEKLYKQSEEMQKILGGKVDVVGKYIFLNLPPSLQLRALEEGNLEYINELKQSDDFDDAKRTIEKKLEDIEAREKYELLEKKFYNANKILGETYEAALALGLKGEAAEKAGVVVDSAGQLSSIALSFASVNPIGIISGALQSIGFLGRLFNKKRGYYPTLKALNQIGSQIGDMYKSMNEGFQHIDNKIGNLAEINIEMYNSLMEGIEKQMQFQEDWFMYLDENQKNIMSNQQRISNQIEYLHKATNEGFQHIDNKLNSLAEINIKMYNAMMKGIQQQTQFQQEWFGYLTESHKELRDNQQKILRRTDDLMKLIINESEQDIGILIGHEEKRRNGLYDNLFLETFEDYKVMYGLPKFSDGLSALYSIVSNISNGNESYFSLLADSSDISLAYYEIIELYEPLRDIFNSINSHDNFIKPALNSLLLPTTKINDSNEIHSFSKEVNTDSVFYQVKKLYREYFSPQSIAELSHLYITYAHYFEFYKDGNTLEPGTMEEYLELSDRQKEIRVADIISNIDNLIDITNRAIAQQSVMAGHSILGQISYSILEKSRPELRPKIINAVKGNYLLSHNLVKFLLHSNLHELRTAEGLRTIGLTKGKEGKSMININDELSITLPSLKEVEDNEMSYPADLYVLLDTKQKLIAKRMDMEFSNVFSVSLSKVDATAPTTTTTTSGTSTTSKKPRLGKGKLRDNN